MKSIKHPTKKTLISVVTIFFLFSLCLYSYAIGIPEGFATPETINGESATVQVGETSKVVISLGPEFANRNFALETDAGMDSHAYKSDSNGNVEFIIEQGGSSQYALTILSDKETVANTNQTAVSVTNEENTTEPQEDNDKSGVNTKNIILFAAGLVLAVVYLVVSKVLPRIKEKKSTSQPSEENSEDYNDDDEM